MNFAEHHPLIRDLGIYNDFINQTQHAQKPQNPSPQAAPLGAH
jgi:hypothetical protein